MPELPEVETVVRGLAPRLTGRPLRNPVFFKPDIVHRITPRRFLSGIRNRTVVGVTRRAKHIVMQIEGGHRWIVQLRMTGNLFIHAGRLRGHALDYVAFKSSLANGETLVYRDVRRLGAFLLLDEDQWRSYTERLGPEPLAEDFDIEKLASRFARSRTPIKKAIMDQRVVVGVGNIYANEALFRAGIDPSRPANQVSLQESETLMHHVINILQAAIDAGGTTLRDYRNADDEEGTFQRDLDVYGRAGEPCVRCGTALVTTQELDGRQTVLCWRCQT